MKKKIIYLSLASTLAIPQGGAMEDFIGNSEVLDHFGQEIEAAQVQAATAHSLLSDFTAQKEDEDLQIATALSLRADLESRIGGDAAVPVEQRLQGHIKTLSVKAPTLEDAVGSLSTALKGIPGNNLRERIESLQKRLIWETQETDKVKTTNKALQREIAAREQEQREKNELLDDVLSQAISQEAAPLPIQGNPVLEQNNLSSYQQRLQLQRDKGKIGDQAWELLGRENSNLAVVLFNTIKNLEQTVEIFCIENNSFKLRVNKKEQSKLYKF